MASGGNEPPMSDPSDVLRVRTLLHKRGGGGGVEEEESRSQRAPPSACVSDGTDEKNGRAKSTESIFKHECKRFV